MEKNDFTQRTALINDIQKQIGKERVEIERQRDMVTSLVNDVVNLASKRDTLYSKYLNFINELSFDIPTVSSDLFPGIKPTLNSVDLNDLQKKADTMKQYAQDIDSLNHRYGFAKASCVKTLKSLLSTMLNVINQEDQIQDLSTTLLYDLDSPYDVGQLARNS